MRAAGVLVAVLVMVGVLVVGWKRLSFAGDRVGYVVFGIVAIASAVVIAVVSPVLAVLFFLTSLGAAVSLERLGGRKVMWFGAGRDRLPSGGRLLFAPRGRQCTLSVVLEACGRAAAG